MSSGAEFYLFGELRVMVKGKVVSLGMRGKWRLFNKLLKNSNNSYFYKNNSPISNQSLLFTKPITSPFS